MAQLRQIVFIDDLDGSDAQGTVRFGLGGTDYEIDLSTANTDELRTAIQPYIKAARTTSSTPRRASRTPVQPGSPTPAAVRQWAKDQGIAVKDKGRVPDELAVRFRAAGR